MKIIKKSFEIGGRTLTFETGRLAQQANAAVLASYGETMVLAAVVSSAPKAELDYFPLSVEYIERLYAGGRIKGSRWVKREGRPSDEAILTARLVDRSIRPLFPKGYKNEVQVTVTVLSVDGENDPDILGILATSAALSISNIPWKGPIAAARVGWIAPKEGEQGHYLINPLLPELNFSELDLVVSGTKAKTIMLEGKGKQLREEIVLGAVNFAGDELEKIIKVIHELVEEVGKKKQEFEEPEINKELLKILEKDYQHKFDHILIQRIAKEEEGEELAVLSQEVFEKYEEKYGIKEINQAFDYLFKKFVRSEILEKDKRPDGRKKDEIRPISMELGVLPRTHGSAIFTRGQTQALTVVTLGAPSLEQLIEAPTGEETKRYIHHYNMPPYSVGETGRVGFSSRREIGHGALAEKALEPVIPPEGKFPYTIRLVSEIMSSNGSTSMASVCGSTLSLMDAGVPITDPVAGIAIGLITDEKKFVTLTDILGMEDFSGDMDFKVAGTKNGITVIQLDVKIPGLTEEIIKDALEKAKKARLFILEKINEAMPGPRGEISRFAPKIAVIHIPTEKIGEVIGPGGKMIRQIITQTNCTVDVEDDGTVTISGTNPEDLAKAVDWVKGLVKEVKPEEIYEGAVKRILPFGAFVEILPGKEGLVHVSQMATGFVKSPEEVVTIGQQVKVRVIEIDDQGRINLSMLFGEDAKKPVRRDRPAPRFGGSRGSSDRFRSRL
ncbi:MAG: polyribonucleotide nucleotidyltransferase [Patescibacteria group bacterium]|nr:polyribonucleotide nucleotidyltransferase [Patescibacteria group bacterium]MCL5095596.1 polyribonucleotide nucleotidyltransferase [Patescibacteria group bacterium]